MRTLSGPHRLALDVVSYRVGTMRKKKRAPHPGVRHVFIEPEWRPGLKYDRSHFGHVQCVLIVS